MSNVCFRFRELFYFGVACLPGDGLTYTERVLAERVGGA